MKTSFRSVQNVFAVVGAALALSPLVTAAANSTNSTSDFVVGAGRVDITPVISPNWLPLNEFELEKLHVRAIVFQNDGVRGAIVSCEVVSLDDPVMQSAIALLAAELDTPASNILFSVTHTHGAAPGGSYPTQNYGGGAVGTYASIGLAAADAVKQAVSKLEPAKVGYSTGRAYYNVNRDAFNELTCRWTQASNLTGPVDREVEVLSFLNMENLPIVSYTSYAMHPVESYLCGFTSADWPGAMSRWIEQSFNDGTVALFSQQASGDVNPLFRRVGTNNLASMNLLPITGFELTQEPVEEPIRDRLIPLSRPDTTYARQLFSQLTALGIMMGEEVIRIMSLTKDYDSNPTIWSKQQNATCPGHSTSPGHYAEIRKVLLDTHLNDKLLKRVTGLFADKKVASKTLLLVRGLLLHRILLLCLKKRWNVQYGLHPSRDPIAVPFEAKGVPSEQAEFGHPDAAILFTCLAFYYSGLDQAQFSEGLRRILSSHDPSSEYDRWTSSCDTLPEALYHWNVINVDDQGQLEELWTHLRTSRSVLDHYMNHFVFPAHAKQFGIKLQASGWDLPLFSKMKSSNNAATGVRTTGFSGTNDNKMMLPLTIRQDDLPSLHQTNAEVLTYLLQDRNREYHLAARGDRRLSERDFLEQLKRKEIRVLIDAGAYILEMGNEALVKAWLDIDSGPQAAVFFGADNRAWVRYRGTKNSVPLLATAFVDNLDNCLVYIDEAHTRGIDLKLPQEARGALTLALGQTKDHTVQAAMRLRQLATTQSLSFFAFPETHQSILDVCKMNDKDKIDSSHVVHWLLEQTCRANEQLQNLYISQGADFCNRTAAEWENAAFLSNLQDRDAYVKVLQRPEQQTLEQLYGNRTDDTQHPSSRRTTSPQIQTFMDELNNLRRAAASNPNALHSSALEEVEQEREVEFQVEEVREVQRPVHYKALAFPGIHPAISAFVLTGVLHGGEGYEHVFTAVSRTSVGQKFSVAATDSQLFASAEFMRTIKTGKHGSIDNFLRPVEWILYSPSTSAALILIAEEAELLISKLRAQKPPAKVHLLTYSAPITKKMLHFSVLTYYALPALPGGHAIPHWLTIELGIFAGRLYMGFEECAPLVEYIENVSNGKRSDALATKAISFLLEWLSLRRKGQDIMHTPISYVCQGRPLDSGHAFFVTHRVDDKGVVKSYRIDGTVDGAGEEERDEEDEWDGVDENELA